ncbi:MAG: ATP-binding cassette domain-containing protein [Planctomycetota bacterium]|nr:MAG: ATP-binding cassette domain-containing protein [Planctomycetota bacterium]REJ96242.1 MAG: ATP-binding cassette domain-containing protein [Planctomycetota bacterium]REK31475.1 MAG: ATP-binding cassette domain-containing protein [Planctomycetota bacterium]REK40705.1 MAG: ATP-binding cassette domain-containing protein [Planctomycetota bacterium]
MNVASAIAVEDVSFSYGPRRALDSVSFSIPRGEIFAFVGPNGGGKTTLFRLLTTLVPLQSGSVRIESFDLARDVRPIRPLLGVVFQAPSLDKKLTVVENLQHHGHLYGVTGPRLAERIDELLARFNLGERRDERTEKLSGGLRRRVELAKSLLHQPRILLLDEPSTALDPMARSELWQHLEQIRQDDGVTIALTTHLLEEAERADRVGIMHEGRLVALDTPDALRDTIGGDAITIRAAEPAGLAAAISERFACDAHVVDGDVRLEREDGHRWVAQLVEAFPGAIDSITFARPSLEDVFVARTGHLFRDEVEEAVADSKEAVR